MNRYFKKSLRMMCALGVFLTATALAQPVYFDCRAQCQAMKAVKGLKTYTLSNKGALKNPLGSEVCTEVLKGTVTKANGKNVCRFNDKSSVELQSLHFESEKFLKN